MNRVIEYYNKKYTLSGGHIPQRNPGGKLKGINIGPTTTFTNPSAAAASSNTPAPLAGVAAAFAAAAAVNGGTAVTAATGGSGGGGGINSNPATTTAGTTTVLSSAPNNSAGVSYCNSNVRRIGNGEKYRRMENGSNLSQSMDSVNTVEKFPGEEEVSKYLIYICVLKY